MGNKVSLETWILLAKYLFDEGTAMERMLVEEVLKSDADLKSFHDELAIHLKGYNKSSRDAKMFVKLDKRIKAYRKNSEAILPQSIGRNTKCH